MTDVSEFDDPDVQARWRRLLGGSTYTHARSKDLTAAGDALARILGG